MPKVSIIVPVYKAEKYLRRCLDSIQTQTLTDFEALLIDDGSPDRSGKICDEYVEKDERFRAFHKENGGVASARQMGMDHAQGEYIIHCDPDDWVDKDWIDSLYNKAKKENLDIISCDFIIHHADKSEYLRQKPTSFDSKDIIKELLAGPVWGSCWNKLVRRRCFEEYDIHFIENMNLWEDLYVTCELLQHSMKVGHIEKALYHYDNYSNDNSICRFLNIEQIQSVMTFIDHFDKIFTDSCYDEGWYIKKCRVKQTIYKYRRSKFNIKDTYSEINHRYLLENKGATIGSEAFYISLCLKGIPLRIVAVLQDIIATLSTLSKKRISLV